MKKKHFLPKADTSRLPGPGEQARMFDEVFRTLHEKTFATPKEAEEYLNRMLKGEVEPTPPTAAEKAQNLVYDAWDEADGKRRRKLACEALALDQNCADAYVVLAGESSDIKSELELLKQAVSAGERAIGEKGFREYVGQFWGTHGTRPYMRARAALAQVLWSLDRREEAIAHYRELLRLNPNDNQGLRYALVGWLAEVGDFAGVAGLLVRYPEDSAGLNYARALLEFHNCGDSDAAREALGQAFEANDWVPDALLHWRPDREYLPDGYSPGREDEAIMVTHELGAAWRKVPGALDWLRRIWDKHWRET